MRRLSALSAALTATALAYTNSAAAAVAPEAPLAPINTSLLQGNPAAPLSIDDVLLVPSASAGQKGAAFEWADGNHVQAYVLWNNFFAAAQYTPAGYVDVTDSLTRTDSSAQTVASFGYMNPGFGVGVSLAYRNHLVEDEAANKTVTSQQFSQFKLFASMSNSAMDIYGSLLWGRPEASVYIDSSSKYAKRYDLVSLQVGARHAPAAGAEGLAWNAYVTPGFEYDRPDHQGSYTWFFDLNGQIGYAFLVDGIQFLPGVDAFVNYINAKGDAVRTDADWDSPDYFGRVGVAPNVSVSVPLFEHWTLVGGAKYYAYQTLNDRRSGSPSYFNDESLITNTTGNVGLRYAHDRWAAEAGVSNGFLNRGPNFVSGASGDLLYSFGFTVNLK